MDANATFPAVMCASTLISQGTEKRAVNIVFNRIYTFIYIRRSIFGVEDVPL